jgi:two-component system sensor histidine kinase CreC
MRLTRLTLLFIALIIGSGFYLLVKRQLEVIAPQTFQATEESLVDTAHLLASLIESDLTEGEFRAARFAVAFDSAKNRQFQAPVGRYGRDGFNLGAYITDRHGTVVFHSERPGQVGEDYSEIPEVARCLRGLYGARRRVVNGGDSDSGEFHVAAPIGDPVSPIGVVSLSKPQADVLPIVRRRRKEIWWGAGLAGSGILGLVGAIFLWQYRPMSRLTAFARSIEQGGRPETPRLGAGREVNTLARALQSMRESLEGRRYAERYVQTLTHEMKSPLAGIRGAAELLDETMTVDDRRRFLANIQAESLRAERLLDRLLQLSALEGRTEIEKPERIDFTELVQRAIDQAKPAAELARVRLLVRLAKDLPAVAGDAFILRAAVTNLLENAIDFSPPRGVVSVKLDTHGERLVLTVEDRGPGIPEYARDKVFERFFSLRHLKQDGRKGTGLGLTLVKEAVELHQGRIEIEAAEPHGCRVRLTLPHPG